MSPTPSEPVVMTVSGFDPLGGAGVIADLKTFGANGCYGVAAITAVDVQERASALNEIYPIDVHILRSGMKSILAESKVRAIKLGMLATRANAEAVFEVLEEHPSLPVVLDPLVRASGGVDLKDTNCVEFVRDRLLLRATVITPNLLEAAALTGLKVEDLEDMKLAARKLIEMGARSVVVTGDTWKDRLMCSQTARRTCGPLPETASSQRIYTAQRARSRRL